MAWPTHIVAVGGIALNDEGAVLLVKTYHGGWVFPGGQVEIGENLIDALIREIKEESGIDVTVSQLIGVYSNTSTYKGFDGVTEIPTKVIFDFICKPVGGELWVAKDKVLDLITAPAIRTRYQAYLDYDGNTRYMNYVTGGTFEVKLDRTV